MMMTLNELLESKTIGKRLEQMKVTLEDVINKLRECDTDDYRVNVQFSTKMFEIVLRDTIKVVETDKLIKRSLDDEPKMEMFKNWLLSYCNNCYQIGMNCYYNISDWTITFNDNVIFLI